MTIRPLTLLEAEYIAHRLAYELMNSSSEPIPEFKTTDMKKLESSLHAPFHTYDGKYFYRTFVDRAAVLFYLITKNHCFSNGNKRMAVTLTSVFCFVNKRWIKIAPDNLYRLACSVAESDPRDKDQVVRVIAGVFRKSVEPLPKDLRVDMRKYRGQ